MTRKVKLEWIANDSARKASLKKRRLGLIKKVVELTTLCDVDACLVIYSPEESEPMVWPSEEEARRQLGEFQKIPELERVKKMTNQETYLKQRVIKEQEQMRKLHLRNKEVEVDSTMHQIHQGKGIGEFSRAELQWVIWFVEERMRLIRKRRDGSDHQQVPSEPACPTLGDLPPPRPASQGPADDLGGDHGSALNDSLMLDQWFMDLMDDSDLVSGSSSSSISMRSADMSSSYYDPFAGSAADGLGLSRPSFGGSSSSVAAEMGLPPIPSFGGCSGTFAAEMGLPPFQNFRDPTFDMGLPPLIFRPNVGATHRGMGLPPPPGSVEGSGFGSDMGVGMHPFGDVGSSSGGFELGGLPFGLHGGGSSSSGAGSNEGLPSDEKTLPNNNSP